MRIISGRLKGRQLKSFKADHIRPTTDRVKESIFNILQGELIGARVLDLFSGTGNLSIESWSREASFVEAVESNRQSIQIIKENLSHLGVHGGVRVVQMDVFRYVKNYKGEPFNLIFVDPPFTEALAHSCMEALSRSQVAQPGTIVVIESRRQEKVEDNYGSFQLLDRRQFGDKNASFFKKAEA